MKIVVYFAHPAQYMFLRNTIRQLFSNGHNIKILIKTKDVLEKLVSNDNLPYQNILIKERSKSIFGIILSLIKRNFKIFSIIKKINPNLLISTDASLAQLGYILNIPRITVLEDDYEIIKPLAILTYPFTSAILCPNVCRVGRWDAKKIGYDGYMKLGYLHPKVFQPNVKVIKDIYNINEDYIIIRLARLTAHHDKGIKGINDSLLTEMINFFESKSMKVLISSESELSKKYIDYKLEINPSHMHHVLAGCNFFVSDSQSMSVESALLGVPSIRFSTFAGKISVLEELEHKYNLTFGINPDSPEKLFKKLNDLFSIKNLKDQFKIKRDFMLTQKIDVTSFLVWFIENYPKSALKLKENPEYQNNFK